MLCLIASAFAALVISSVAVGAQSESPTAYSPDETAALLLIVKNVKLKESPPIIIPPAPSRENWDKDDYIYVDWLDEIEIASGITSQELPIAQWSSDNDYLLLIDVKISPQGRMTQCEPSYPDEIKRIQQICSLLLAQSRITLPPNPPPARYVDRMHEKTMMVNWYGVPKIDPAIILLPQKSGVEFTVSIANHIDVDDGNCVVVRAGQSMGHSIVNQICQKVQTQLKAQNGVGSNGVKLAGKRSEVQIWLKPASGNNQPLPEIKFIII